MSRPAQARGTRKTPNRWRQSSAVDFPAMTDLHHEHHEHGVLNLIDDAVIPQAHAVKLALALQLHAPRRARVGGEFGQSCAARRPVRYFCACRSNVTWQGHWRLPPPPVRRCGRRVPFAPSPTAPAARPPRCGPARPARRRGLPRSRALPIPRGLQSSKRRARPVHRKESAFSPRHRKLRSCGHDSHDAGRASTGGEDIGGPRKTSWKSGDVF